MRDNRDVKILFCRATLPPYHYAYYLEKALRENYTVATYGPPLWDELVRCWNIEDIRDRAAEPTIPYFTDNIADVLNSLSFTPDILLFSDAHVVYPLNGINRLPFPTACYLGDTFKFPELYRETARRFDFTFISQQQYIPEFREAGIDNIVWLPVACDPDVHIGRNTEKLYDISFIGALTGGTRGELVEKLRSKFNLHYERCFVERMTEVYSQSKIVFNYGNANGINMKVFEAMASGSMLLTNYIPEVLDLFEDRKHLVFYRNETELFELVDYYLKAEEEREEIAAAGRKEVIGKHTYRHRVDFIVQTIRNAAAPERMIERDKQNGAATKDAESDIARFRDRILNGGGSADDHMSLGKALQSKGQPDEACACYKRAVEIDPNMVEGYNRLGNILKDKGHLDQAMPYYLKAIEIDPGYAESYYNLGILLEAKNDMDNAHLCYVQTIQMNQAHGNAYFRMGNILYGRGQLETAQSMFLKAMRLNPDLCICV
ncbi:MAG: hypothetical protein CSYNP_04329 [Syntrophus sp. SKADARSKE-3]|nr:hypothetical protein [Syntrophus sp. SKADARSKE-3]